MAQPTKGEGRLVQVYSSTSITSGASAMTTPIDISDSAYLGLWYKATPSSAGSGVRIYYEMSYNDTTTNFVIPEGASDVDDSFDSARAYISSVQPSPMRFIRFGATCTSADRSDLVLDAWLFKQ